MLDQAIAFVNSHLMGAAGSVAIVIEFALRLFPSQKPLSIAYGISAIVHKIADLCGALGAFLDKILPQKLS